MINGFSLLEIRKLYLDELYEYHEHTFYAMEQMGTLKEGSYDKLMYTKQGNKDIPVEDTLNQLRKQLKKINV